MHCGFSGAGIECDGWNNDTVILIYGGETGVDGMYSKTYRHKNCPMAVNPGGATTWELHDPKCIKQMASKAPLVNDLFPVHYTKGGVALWKYKSDQLCHEGTRFPMSLLSKLEQRSAQENEYKRQKALVTHCEAYNEKRGGFMPKRTPTGYKTVFHKISGLSRAPSVGVMCDNYNERTEDDQEWLVEQVNSVVSQVIIMDWTFEDAKHIRIDGSWLHPQRPIWRWAAHVNDFPSDT